MQPAWLMAWLNSPSLFMHAASRRQQIRSADPSALFAQCTVAHHADEMYADCSNTVPQTATLGLQQLTSYQLFNCPRTTRSCLIILFCLEIMGLSVCRDHGVSGQLRFGTPVEPPAAGWAPSTPLPRSVSCVHCCCIHFCWNSSRSTCASGSA